VYLLNQDVQTVSKTMPETNVHRGDEEIGGVQLHTYYHNVSAVAIFVSVPNFDGLHR
jgi:hypothetical protein